MKTHRILRAHKDERGIAIIVVMLVMMVLLSLSLAVVQLSEHSGSTANLDQRRAQSINLAEAAIDTWVAPLPHTNANRICDMNGATVTPTLSPRTEYVLSIELFVGGTFSDDDRVGCEGYSGSPSGLTGARVTARAVAGTATQNSTTSQRFLQEEVALAPIYGPALSNAIYGGTRINISNNSGLTQFEDPNDANIYSPGNIGCDYPRPSGSNVSFNSGFSLEGSVVAGKLICSAAGKIYGNLWAGDGISVGQDLGVGFGGVDFSGFVTTFDGGITRTGGNAQVENDCTAPLGTAPAINCLGGANVSPPCPAEVGAVVIYDTSMCDDPADIGAGMPQFTFISSQWTDTPPGGLPRFGYHVATSCANAIDWFKGVAGTRDQADGHGGHNWVVNATGLTEPSGGDCQLAVTSNAGSPIAPLNGHLALIFDGSVSFKSSNTMASTGDWKLWMIHPSDEAVTPGFPEVCFDASGYSTGLDDITISQQTDLSAISSVFLYTPCGIVAQNNSTINGQMIANTVDYAGKGTLNFAMTALPGVEPVGFKASPLFIREIGA